MNREKRIVRMMRPTIDVAGAEMILPNTSGDHVKGIKRQVPVGDADLVNKAYVDAQVATIHARQHSITSTSDHTSTATAGQMLKADANGLPVNATNTDAQVSAAYDHSQDNSQAHSDYLLNTGDTATGDYTFDTTTLKIDATNDRVGIGTASPTNQLTVAGGITLSAAGGTFEAGAIYSDANWGFLFRPRVAGTIAAHSFMNSAGDAHRLTILDTGNVGINTTTPGNRLTVVSTTSAIAYFGGNDGNNWITLSDNNGTNTCNYGVIGGGNAYIYTLGYISFYPGGANWIRFTADGDAGFGITTPDARVEIETQSNEGAQALTIDQNDEDVAFIDFQGTSEAGVTKNISSYTAAQFAGFIKVEINGTARWMAFFSDPYDDS